MQRRRLILTRAGIIGAGLILLLSNDNFPIVRNGFVYTKAGMNIIAHGFNPLPVVAELDPSYGKPIAFSHAQQASDESDLRGLWRYAGGSVIEISRHGTELLGVYVAPNEEMAALGFQPGDWTFRGQPVDHTLRGTVHIRYPLDFQKKCPTGWDTEAVFAAEVSADMNSIEGQWREQFTLNDCRIVQGGWVPLRLEAERSRHPRSRRHR